MLCVYFSESTLEAHEQQTIFGRIPNVSEQMEEGLLKKPNVPM